MEFSKAPLTELTDAERLHALERFAILRPYIEQNVSLNTIAKDNGIHPKTLRRWLSAYRCKGLSGLVRKTRSDRSTPKIPTQLKYLIEGLALQKPAPSVSSIHRQVLDVAVDKGWPQPSYGCVYRVVQRLDPALLCLAVEGSKVYRERFDLIHRREADGPNAIWQADHTLLDIWLVDDRGQPHRPWLTCIMYDYSRAVAGYFIGFGAPSALITSLALRQAIWRKEDHRWHICGIPQAFYTDHGSDFTSHHLEQVAADLKMRLMFSIPGMPRGRGRIERFFETVNQLLLCGLPGYAPAKAQGVHAKASLTLTQLDEKFRAFILDTYHRRLHGGMGCTPQMRWGAGGFLPHLPESLEHLDLLLLTVAKSRRVRPDGIRFQCMRYIDPTLAAYIGQNVTIRYDPRDLAEIRVYHDNTFVCRAVCQELAGQVVGLKEVIRARNRRRKQLQGEVKSRSEVVEQFLAVHQPEPPIDCVANHTSSPTTSLKRYFNE